MFWKKISLMTIVLCSFVFANNNNYIVFNSPNIKIQKIENYKNFQILNFNYKKYIKDANKYSSCIINKTHKLKTEKLKQKKQQSIEDSNYDYYLFCAQPGKLYPVLIKLKVINPDYIKEKDTISLSQTIYKKVQWNTPYPKTKQK